MVVRTCCVMDAVGFLDDRGGGVDAQPAPLGLVFGGRDRRRDTPPSWSLVRTSVWDHGLDRIGPPRPPRAV